MTSSNLLSLLVEEHSLKVSELKMIKKETDEDKLLRRQKKEEIIELRLAIEKQKRKEERALIKSQATPEQKEARLKLKEERRRLRDSGSDFASQETANQENEHINFEKRFQSFEQDPATENALR